MIDHVVWAVPNLADGVAEFRERTGVSPTKGGSHVGLGTANFLVALGSGAYLEIIGPDPDQPDPAQPRPFGLDDPVGPRVAGWCLRPVDLDGLVAAATARGYDPGTPRVMTRQRSAGSLLTWRLTRLPATPSEMIVPFLIDWASTPHPTTAPLPLLPMRSLRAEHPVPALIQSKLTALDANLQVDLGPQPRLFLEVESSDGPIVLG